MAQNGSYELSLEALGVNLPYSVEAEQAVLGAVLVDAGVLDDIGASLLPEHFYHAQNAGIFREMLLLSAAAQPVDFVTVLEAVKSSGVFASEEDAKLYLYNITQTVPTISNAAAYARIVYDKYIQRALISVCRDVMSEASSGALSSELLLEHIEQRVYEVRGGRDRSELWRLESVLTEVIKHLENISGPDRDKYRGLPTGFDMLDRVLTGLNKSDLIVLAARPGVGKTSFALNIAANLAAKRTDVSIAYFSLEMTKQQIAQRILSSTSGIESMVFRSGVTNPESWSYIAESMGRLARANVYIDDTSGISVAEIKAKARRLKDLGLVVVDYLQLMGGSGARRTDSRVNEISDITRAFKIMAKELNVPVVLLSQLSRDSDKQSRRPKLSDLRDSGSIEQDADIVMFLHRDATDQPDEAQENAEVLLIIAKNRHGEVTRIKLHWDGEHTRFTALDTYDEGD